VHPALKAYWIAGALVLLCLLLQLTDLELALRFDRALIGRGEWWRLLSANFVHLGWNHLLLNLAGALLVFALFAPAVDNRQWAAALIGVSLIVALAVYVGNPEIRWYVGLSGTLHGLFTWGVAAELRRAPRFAGLLLLGVSAKLAWEQTIGALPGTAAAVGGEVVVDAHLYGAVAGLALGWAWQWWAAHRHTTDTGRPDTSV